jgi:hypothetical protein
MVTIFNTLIILELIALVVIIAFGWRKLLQHWRTSVAALLVLFAFGFVNTVWLIRYGCIHDTIEVFEGLAIVLGFLLAADA